MKIRDVRVYRQGCLALKEARLAATDMPKRFRVPCSTSLEPPSTTLNRFEVPLQACWCLNYKRKESG
ncbi:hypothetical protein QLX08_010516 [Tetragonisca angustula]|uniref:Uncharacterized protein n=1 Tax=Tetragonisca angustula TaxID=166442 RepID=A0AAW0ZC99_9HYME